MDQVYINKQDINRWVGKYFPNKDLISIGDLLGVIEDLDLDVDRLNEKVQDLEQDIEDNYRPLSVSEQLDL